MKDIKRVSHCRACDAFFDTYNRTVIGPEGAMVIEENLCQTCRRKVTFFHDLETDEEAEVTNAADWLHLISTGRQRGSPSTEG